jgi:cell division transport system permease protein
MIWINTKRILKTGFVNFWRNGVVSLSAVLVMSITLMIISSVIFTGALLDNTLNGLREKVDVNVTVLPEVFEEDILLLQRNIESLPEVESVEYISREEVLANYQERHAGDQKILAALEELSDNPFGATLNVRAISPDNYEGIDSYLQQNYPTGQANSIIDDVNFAQKREAINSLAGIIDAGEKFGIIITFVFILLSILITLNTIRLAMYISKDEIKVMNLVGAESSYISGPFIVTGAMYGILSGLLVMILLYPITYWVGPSIQDVFFGLNIFSYYISNFGQMFVIIFASGIMIGAISSFLAINRYLKK